MDNRRYKKLFCTTLDGKDKLQLCENIKATISSVGLEPKIKVLKINEYDLELVTSDSIDDSITFDGGYSISIGCLYEPTDKLHLGLIEYLEIEVKYIVEFYLDNVDELKNIH